jgi:hypothetical protein
MQSGNIVTGPDLVRWMANQFDPDNSRHVALAPDMAFCVLMNTGGK